MKDAGIDEIIVYCVNDAAVMTAWAKDQGIIDDDDDSSEESSSMITFVADPTSALTKATGMELTAEGPVSVGLIGPRCKRHALWVVKGTIQHVAIAESEFDPAGDDFPEKTLGKNTF